MPERRTWMAMSATASLLALSALPGCAKPASVSWAQNSPIISPEKRPDVISLGVTSDFAHRFEDDTAQHDSAEPASF